MFYGFGVSPYLYMMRRSGMGAPGGYPGATPPIAEEENQRHPWRDMLLPKSYSGEDVPDDVAHQARARGLGALGQALLKGSSSNDWGGALAEGFAGMSEARDSVLERNRVMGMQRSEEERQKAAEARAQAQEADRSRMAPIQQQSAEAELENYREKQQQGRDLRAKTGKSADQMVAEINSLAAANPEDETLQRMAKRAAGYALGEDSDLNSLAKLHNDMTVRAGRDEDEQWQTKTDIAKAEEQGKHGFGPIAEGSRAERGLDLEAERSRLYAQQVGKQGDGQDVKPAGWYDRVNREINSRMDQWLAGRMKMIGKHDYDEEARTGKVSAMGPPTQEEIDAKRREFEAPSIDYVNNLFGQAGTRGGSIDVSGARGGNEVVEPRNRAPNANHARNLAVESLLAGHSPDDVLDAIPDVPGLVDGYTRQQIFENAKLMARSKGWSEPPKRDFPMPTNKDNFYPATSPEDEAQYWEGRKQVTRSARTLVDKHLPGGADIDGIIGRVAPGSSTDGEFQILARGALGHVATNSADKENPKTGLERASVAAREVLRTNSFSPESLDKLQEIGRRDPTQIYNLPAVKMALSALPKGAVRTRASQEAIRMAREGFSERQIVDRLTGGTGEIESPKGRFYFDEDGEPKWEWNKEWKGQ